MTQEKLVEKFETWLVNASDIDRALVNMLLDYLDGTDNAPGAYLSMTLLTKQYGIGYIQVVLDTLRKEGAK